MSNLTRAYAAAKLAMQANAPTLMVVGGVVSMGAGAVVACKKTLHLEETLGPHTATLEAVQDTLEHNDSYTEDMARQDRIKIYTRASLDVGRLYLVPGVCFVAGGVMVFKGHHMMLKRNATLALAFTGLKEAFDKYRGRVVESFGSETDQAMMNGWVPKEVVDEVTGEKTVIHTRDWEGEPNGDPYNRVFEEGESNQWVPDLSANKLFIQGQQRFAQQRLAAQGYLYLSDVYEALGFPETDISRVVGWKVTRRPDGTKDIPVVDFGLDKPHPDDWKYDRERAIYLDFNCQGLIVGGRVQKALEASR